MKLPRRHRLLRALLFILFYFIAFMSFTLPCCIMALVCRTSFEHRIYVYVLTMGVFTTSWWVVNQIIVVVIFTLLPQVQKTLLSYHWWSDTLFYYDYCCLLCIRSLWDAHLWFMSLILSFMNTFKLLYDFAGRCPVSSIVWAWQPRDCIREAYKRIGHAEISNF